MWQDGTRVRFSESSKPIASCNCSSWPCNADNCMARLCPVIGVRHQREDQPTRVIKASRPTQIADLWQQCDQWQQKKMSQWTPRQQKSKRETIRGDVPGWPWTVQKSEYLYWHITLSVLLTEKLVFWCVNEPGNLNYVHSEISVCGVTDLVEFTGNERRKLCNISNLPKHECKSVYSLSTFSP